MKPLLLLALPLLTLGQVVEPPPPAITGKVLLTWAPVTLDVNGGPIVVTGYEIGISPGKSDLNANPQQLLNTIRVGPEGYTRADATALFMGLNVENWVLQVRAFKGTLVSAWSDPVIVRLPFALIAPGRPVGVRVTVNIEIEAQ